MAMFKCVNSNLKPTLLWTNPNPNGTFLAQDITLGLADYSGILIKYKANSTDNRISYSYQPIEQSGSYTGITIFNPATVNFNIRGALVNTTNISFGTGYLAQPGSTTREDNNRAIPLEIYGVKNSLF